MSTKVKFLTYCNLCNLRNLRINISVLFNLVLIYVIWGLFLFRLLRDSRCSIPHTGSIPA